MILCPLSKVTTSATQLGAHEWLMYLQATFQKLFTTFSIHRESFFLIILLFTHSQDKNTQF